MPPREKIPDLVYAPILLTIESIIHFMDEEAQRAGIVWADAQVIGVINAVLTQAKGREIRLELGDSLSDRLLGDLRERLIQAHGSIFEELRQSDGTIEKRPLRKLFWVGSLNTILHAARLRKSTFPGTRRYLDYLKVFITSSLKRAENAKSIAASAI